MSFTAPPARERGPTKDGVFPMTKTLNPWRVAGWSALAILLLVPAVAMRFTAEVDWDETDFIVMGAMLLAVGLGVEFLFRRSGSAWYRVGAAVAVLAAFLTVWANLAVGFIRSEDNPYNLLFTGVVGLSLLGAAAVRFRPGGMALVTATAALLQAGLALGGLVSDPRGGTFSLMFALPWLVSASLFRAASISSR